MDRPPSASVLIVDDDASIVAILSDYLRHEFSVTSITDPGDALRVARAQPFDVILLDRLMQDMDGLEVLEHILSEDPRAVVILMTGQPEVDSAVESLKAGAYDYVSKPLNFPQLSATIRRAIEKSRLRRENAAIHDIIRGLANTIEAKDPLTRGHTGRVARVSITLGRALGLQHDELRTLWNASLLHDIGKIGIPDSILLKPGPLTSTERLAIHRHPEIGSKILEPIERLAEVRRCIMEHHERWDGTGYPQKIKGGDIGFLSRILSIAEVFDALAQRRCYKPAWSQSQVIEFFESESGGQFDPDLVPPLLRLLQSRWDEMIRPLESSPVSSPS